jgi:diguanylate cyclase (GGDEF)-like protein/PAS domain S-box-containing protein
MPPALLALLIAVLIAVLATGRVLLRRQRELGVRLAKQGRLLDDRTARLEAATAELRTTQARFRAMVQNASDAILVVEPDASVTFRTPAAERILGLAADEPAGTRLTELLHPDDRARALSFVAAAAGRRGVTEPVEWRMRHPRGLWQHVEVLGSNQLGEAGVEGIVLTVRSIEERRALTERLRHQAFHDALTGLANRSLFRDRVEHALSRRGAAEGSVAVMFVDLDDFKLVNDSLGHQAGDRLLVTVAERLRACLRPMDTAARLGGDEFAVLLEEIHGVGGAIEVAERIIDLFRLPVLLAGNEVFVHGSIGIAVNLDQAGTEDMLRNADLAMYAAKSADKGGYEIFRPSLHQATVERLQLKADLQLAIDFDQLVLQFQPIVDLHPDSEGRPVGLEALLRWRHPERGLMAPESFIPLAEDSGLIVPIGQWVLAAACRQAKQWHETLPDDPRWVSVNVSARQLAQPDLVEQVLRVLDETGLDPGLLVVELTESLLMRDTDATIAKLTALRAAGVRLAIDDFGTGYSSLSYLSRFPVDILKVGKIFVDGLTGQTEDGALARVIVNLSHTMHLTTVAEGVTGSEQVAQLQALGCELAQGFYYFKPLDAAEVEALLVPDGQVARPVG